MGKTTIRDLGLMTDEEVARMRRPAKGSLISGRKLTVEDIYIPPQPLKDIPTSEEQEDLIQQEVDHDWETMSRDEFATKWGEGIDIARDLDENYEPPINHPIENPPTPLKRNFFQRWKDSWVIDKYSYLLTMNAEEIAKPPKERKNRETVVKVIRRVFVTFWKALTHQKD